MPRSASGKITPNCCSAALMSAGCRRWAADDGDIGGWPRSFDLRKRQRINLGALCGCRNDARVPRTGVRSASRGGMGQSCPGGRGCALLWHYLRQRRFARRRHAPWPQPDRVRVLDRVREALTGLLSELPENRCCPVWGDRCAGQEGSPTCSFWNDF